MKQTILILLLTAGLLPAEAQDRYTAAMKKNIALLDSAKTPAALNELSAAFERIAEAEKNKWLPYYYAALSQVWIGYRDKSADKDMIAEKANAFIAKAELLERNVELSVLKYMVASLQMQVNPMSRWQQYGPLMSSALEEGKRLDANNPRICYMEGMNLFYTPTAFGGGKELAKPVLQKAVSLFEGFKATDELSPTWGKTGAVNLLGKCE